MGCDIGGTTLDAIDVAATGLSVLYCYIHDTASGKHGILANELLGFVCYGNIIARCNDGIRVGSITAANRNGLIAHNTFDSNISDGIQFTATTAPPITLLNNIFSNNGADGVSFSSGSVTVASLQASRFRLLGCCFYNNAGNKYTPTGLDTAGISLYESVLNPTYTSSGTGNYSIGTNLKGLGYPVGGTVNIGGSTTYSYVDIGASQRQETGGGGSGGSFGFS
jgi:hypothetical protein